MKMPQEGPPEFTEREQKTLDNLDFKVGVLHLDKTVALAEALEEHTGKPSKAFVEFVSDGSYTIKDGHLSAA